MWTHVKMGKKGNCKFRRLGAQRKPSKAITFFSFCTASTSRREFQEKRSASRSDVVWNTVWTPTRKNLKKLCRFKKKRRTYPDSRFTATVIPVGRSRTLKNWRKKNWKNRPKIDRKNGCLVDVSEPTTPYTSRGETVVYTYARARVSQKALSSAPGCFAINPTADYTVSCVNGAGRMYPDARTARFDVDNFPGLWVFLSAP